MGSRKSGAITWALIQARKQTISLAREIPQAAACSQSFPGEHHPSWILGHLLLADTYLLHLIGIEELGTDFGSLLACYGPGAVPVPGPGPYESLVTLITRVSESGEERAAAVSRLSSSDIARVLPDPVLVQTQPTVGHHIQSMIYHEGYHGGQLAAWRRNHHLAPVPWTFAPPAV
jgi:hypothetical protein